MVPVPPVLVSCLPPGSPLVAIPVFFVGLYDIIVLVCMVAGGGVAPSSDPSSLAPPPRFLVCIGLGGERGGRETFWSRWWPSDEEAGEA